MLEGLDEEGSIEEPGHLMTEKKRRLSEEQVKALEKNFEVENKLEPERKVKLAQELGLQPRQVAVWFQNRRARWKTKQLERDYGVLKANYDSLNQQYESLIHDNEALLNEIRELKAKNGLEVKEEEALESESEEPELNRNQNEVSPLQDHEAEFNGELIFFADLKDGSSDSDSSAILNDDNSPKEAAGMSFSGSVSMMSNGGPFDCFPFPGNQKQVAGDDLCREEYQPPHLVKVEELNLLGAGCEEECSSFFSDEEPPILHWYSPDHWRS